MKSLGADVVEELLANGAKLEDISKLVTNLKKLGLSDEVISMFAKNFGDTGLDWLRKARGLGASPDVLKQLSQMDGFADKMDEIFELMKGSSKNADDVAECLIKNGDEAIEIIRKYGDDAVDAIIVHGDDAVSIIGKYGDDAVDRLKQGKTPDEIEKELGGKPGENSGLSRVYREALSSDAELITNIKTKYNAGKTRNAALARGTIDGKNFELECISGEFTHENYFNKGNFEPPSPENYHYNGPIPEYTNHTEQKMVEYLWTLYKDTPDISGEIEIISERLFCENCNVVVDMFEQEFPNIKIIRVEVYK